MDKLRKIIRDVLKETYGPKMVKYSAVVIEDPVQEHKIKDLATQYVPQGWHQPAHYHMTISQGQIPQSLELKGDLNKEVELTINSIGQSETAIAFGTFGYYSKNDVPHITIAFSREYGAVDSKEIKNWKPIDRVKVIGVIREIGEKNKILKDGELEEVLGSRGGAAMTTTTLYAHPGIPAEFPNADNFDQFGNREQDITR